MPQAARRPNRLTSLAVGSACLFVGMAGCIDSSAPPGATFGPGDKIAYLLDVYHNRIETRVKLLHLVDHTIDPILSTPLVTYYHLRPAPDGVSVIVSRDDRTGFSGASVFRVDLRTAQSTPQALVGAAPEWDPSGTRLAGSVSTGSGTAIVVADIDGVVIDTLALGERPVWSPDGSQIAISYSPDNIDTEIGVISAAGPGPRTNLTNSPGLDALPAWSPDGTTIAFYSSRTARPGVYLMQRDGSNQRFLYPAALTLPPAWSPDGHQLALFDASGPNNNLGLLLVIRTDGRLRNTLPFAPGAVSSFSWSPDGEDLLVVARDSYLGRHDHLFVVPRGTSRAIALLPDSVYVAEAQWVP